MRGYHQRVGWLEKPIPGQEADVKQLQNKHHNSSFGCLLNCLGLVAFKGIGKTVKQLLHADEQIFQKDV